MSANESEIFEVSPSSGLDAADQQLLRDYLDTLQMQPGNTLKLFAIGFIGLLGSGKSTIANALSEATDLPVSRSDDIRRYLNAAGFPGAAPRQEIMATLAEERTLHFYRHDTSVIIDANFREFAARSRANAARHGAELLLVRAICPEELILERLWRRQIVGDVCGSRGDIANYWRAKEAAAGQPVDEADIYTEVDTSQAIEPQIGALCLKLTGDGYIER